MQNLELFNDDIRLSDEVKELQRLKLANEFRDRLLSVLTQQEYDWLIETLKHTPLKDLRDVWPRIIWILNLK